VAKVVRHAIVTEAGKKVRAWCCQAQKTKVSMKISC